MRFQPPRLFSAAQVCAEFYRRARNAGMTVYVDHVVKLQPDQTRKKIRLDAIVVVGGNVVCIVVCTRGPNAHRGYTLARKTFESFKVPVVWIRGMKRLPFALEEVKKIAADAGWKAKIVAQVAAELGLDDVS